MAPHTINTTVADIQLGKKIIFCTPANSSSLITSATNNNVDRCRQLVELVFVHHSPVRHPAGDASTGWYCHQWTSVTVRATPARSPDCFDESVKAWSAPSFASESGQSSSLFLPVTPLKQFCPLAWFYRSKCTNAVIIQQCYFLLYYINANTNKY